MIAAKEKAKSKADQALAAGRFEDESEQAQIESHQKKLEADIAEMKEGLQLLALHLDKLDMLEEAIARPDLQWASASASTSASTPASSPISGKKS
jgi:hypothetical protein